MGRELMLYIIKDEIWSTDHEVKFERDEEFFSFLNKHLITTSSPHLLDHIFHRNIFADAYGAQLRRAHAGPFSRLLGGTTFNETMSDWNKAIVAYLRELPQETPLVLFWH